MLTVKHTELEAVALAASTEQTRYYLKGVYFETYADNHYGMIATDGHRLHSIGACIDKVPSKDCFILANDDVKKAIQMAKAEMKSVGKFLADKIRIRITLADNALAVTIAILDNEGALVRECGGFTTKPIDGNFPNWRQVFPSSAGDGAISIGFNASYLADFGKAAKILGASNQQIAIKMIDSTSPAIVTLNICEAFSGILMPCRV